MGAYMGCICNFPLFTLIPNTLAVAIDCCSILVLKSYPAGWEHDHFWLAVATGFSGSLSTVSTFIAELKNDKLAVMFVRELYVLISFGVAMLVLIPPLLRFTCLDDGSMTTASPAMTTVAP